MKSLIFKNLLLLILSVGLYPVVYAEFSAINNAQTLNTLLLFVGLIIVAPLFANFSFSYKLSRDKGLWLSHATTFLAMLICFILLIMIDVIFRLLVGEILVFRITVLLFYVCTVCWDFWDFISHEPNLGKNP